MITSNVSEIHPWLISSPWRSVGLLGQSLIEAWLPLTYAVNSLNRSMGQPDLYPFVLPPAAVDKLRFVHDVVSEWRVGRGGAG